MPVELVRPAAGAAVARRVPFEPTDIESQSQNTIAVPAGGMLAFVRPRRYASPSFMCSIFNTGPGSISARWDGPNCVFGDPAAVLLTPGTGYAEAVTSRMCIAADGTGATVSMSCEANFGR